MSESTAAASNRLHEPLDRLVDRLDTDWAPLLRTWRDSPGGRQLIDFVDARVAAGVAVYPAQPFRALELTPLAQTRAVILGQDPYHGPGQAEGLAFSVPAGVRIPPSLRNIFKELQRDLGLAAPAAGHLGCWARRGVLLLNTALTVEDGRPGSHAGRGWEALTDMLIEAAARDARPKAFLLWGSHAQAKAPLIAAAGDALHRVLRSNHPSPLSATRPPVPFIGCGHFRKAASFAADGGQPLDWSLTGR